MDKREDSLPPEEIVITDERDRDPPPREAETELDEPTPDRRTDV